MQNFNDLLNGYTDGTKDLTVSALTTNSTITTGGNIIPDTAAALDLGSAAAPFQSLNIDNGSTDSGAIYFDGGSTEFIKGNAAGTVLDIGGFTSITAPAAVNSVSAWAVFDGTGTAALIGSFNVTSLVDSGTGQYQINWNVDFSGADNYVLVGSSNSGVCEVDSGSDASKGNFSLRDYAGTLEDHSFVNVLAIGPRT
jgi:hypothetical protein